MFQLIRKDSGEGLVYAVSKGRILVASLVDDAEAASKKKSCGDKAGCGHCGGCAVMPDIYADKFHLPVANADTFKIGGRISYCRYIPEPNIVSALVFGIPITFAVTPMILWLLYAPERAESPLAVLTVVAGFFIGIIILAALDGLFKKRYPSTITNTGEQPR